MTGTDASDRDAARGAMEGDEHGARVLGDAQGEREARYVEAIWGKASTYAAARAVMAVADAEQAELKAEVQRLQLLLADETYREEGGLILVGQLREQRDRAEAAEAEVGRLGVILDTAESDRDTFDSERLDAVLARDHYRARAEAAEGALFELWSNLDSYRDTWHGLVIEDPHSHFVNGVSYCLDDLRTALAISRRAQSAEAAPVSEREAHAGLRARLEALADGRERDWAMHDEQGRAAFARGDQNASIVLATLAASDRDTAAALRALAAEPATPVAAEEGGEQGYWLTSKPAHGWSCDCGDESGHVEQREWVPAPSGSDEQGDRPATPDANGVHDTEGGEGS